MKCRRLWKKFCRGLKFEVLSKFVSGCVEGLYCVEDPYCGEAEVSGRVKDESVSNFKMRPLEKIRFGSADTLTVLTSCNDEILGNLAPFGQDL